MLDPTIVLDLQRAVSLPAFTPPAVVRAWKSPWAERGERAFAPILDDAQRQTHAWRMKVMELEASLPSTVELVWSEKDLADMDSTIRVGENALQEHERHAKRRFDKALKFNRRIAAWDRSAAGVHRQQATAIYEMRVGNIEILRGFVERLRSIRARVDTRLGVEPGFVYRPWRPNAVTLAAIAEADAGHLEVVTLDDLRAELLADD